MASKNLTFIIAAASLLLVPVSCIKEKLHYTPHPDEAQITVTARWDNRGEGVDIPASWFLRIGDDYTEEENDSTHVPDVFFSPGDYGILAWSAAEGISVADSTASADILSEGVEGIFIEGNPDWFFTCALDTTVAADRNYDLTAMMEQQTRELVFTVNATGGSRDRITGMEGCLTGVAGSMNFVTGEYSEESNVGIIFYKISDGEEADIWEASVRLIGIIGASQSLTVEINFENGNPAPVSIVNDLTDNLAGFNNDKRNPLRLESILTDTPEEGDFSAGLGGWEIADGGNIDAH